MKDPLASILKFNESLLEEQLALKYKLMHDNIYSFFRGTAHLFYDNLAEEKKIPASPQVWICGDLHLENFGSYKGENRLVYFDINDFDESLLAPAAFELLRFLSSIFIAFGFLGIERKKAMNMARLFLRIYSQTLSKGKSFYIEPKTAQGLVADFLQSVSSRKQKELLSKRTCKKQGKRMLCVTKKHLALDDKLRRELCDHLDEWVLTNTGRPYNYRVEDVVFRVAGLGSLGLKRYLFLLKSTNRDEKYLLVDMKQSRRSSLKSHVKIRQPQWINESERIIAIQQRMQNVSPFLLSAVKFKKETFVLQELQPAKDSINFKTIKDGYRDIYQVISDMALLTASSQLRSASRQKAAGVDELIKFGMSEKWQNNMIEVAIRQTIVLRGQYRAFRKWYENTYGQEKEKAGRKKA
jgi:uncharacterized protein (DUF2252 family)